MYQNLTNKHVIARKVHRCDWCNRIIEKGEKYNYQSFIFDGQFCDWHAHLTCERVVSAIWDYADPDDGMDSDGFDCTCAEVCPTFICPDCQRWNKEYNECEDDKSYCIEKMDEFFQTHMLYCAGRDKYGYGKIWKCRDKEKRATE